MANSESTYKYVTCVEQLRTVMEENTPVHCLTSASTSEIGKKIVVLNRELILPALRANESLTIQLETG
jgi:hypothetical protein